MLASDDVHPCLPDDPTDDPSVDAEIATVRHALDRSLDEKWDHFRTDFRELWGQFQTECIESSHKLVVAEKAAADERYAVLKDAYDKVKAKCADFDRYNQLLQEKLDHVQEEMKSLSAVSMTIQWEKRVASKQAECKRLTKQLETQKQVNTTLKRENTLLNTQLEQWGEAREAAGKVKDATEAAAAMAAEKAMDATGAAMAAAEKAREATDAAAVAVDKAAVEATRKTAASSVSPPSAMEAPEAKTEPAATSLVDVETSDSTTEPLGVALEAEQTEDASEPTSTTESAVPEEHNVTTEPKGVVPTPTTAPAASLPEAPPPAAPKDTPPSPTTPADTPAPPAITYTLKKLKRKKADTVKTPFLLGSDNVLYAWTEGDKPGAPVGTKTGKGYKFTKK